MVAEKIKTARNPADEGLVGMLVQAQHAKDRVYRGHGVAQLPAGRRENQNVVHKANIEEAGPRQPLVQLYQEERRDQRVEGYFRCLAALAGAGNNLIVDCIIETHDQMNRLASLTAPFDVFYVGVDCPLPELERRERERGDRKIGGARRNHANFQTFGPYDVKVDATLPADANASSLARLWKERQRPGVFRAKATQA